MPLLSTLTAAQISALAAEFAARADAVDTYSAVREAYRRLAACYAKLAAERQAEEAGAPGR